MRIRRGRCSHRSSHCCHRRASLSSYRVRNLKKLIMIKMQKTKQLKLCLLAGATTHEPCLQSKKHEHLSNLLLTYDILWQKDSKNEQQNQKRCQNHRIVCTGSTAGTASTATNASTASTASTASIPAPPATQAAPQEPKTAVPSPRYGGGGRPKRAGGTLFGPKTWPLPILRHRNHKSGKSVHYYLAPSPPPPPLQKLSLRTPSSEGAFRNYYYYYYYYYYYLSLENGKLLSFC